MVFRYRLSTLLNWTVLICFLLWICRLDGGAELWGGIGIWLIAAVLFVALIWVFSFLYGIPSELQGKRGMKPSDSQAIRD
jgi:hypothetical protein